MTTTMTKPANPSAADLHDARLMRAELWQSEGRLTLENFQVFEREAVELEQYIVWSCSAVVVAQAVSGFACSGRWVPMDFIMDGHVSDGAGDVPLVDLLGAERSGDLYLDLATSGGQRINMSCGTLRIELGACRFLERWVGPI